MVKYTKKSLDDANLSSVPPPGRYLAEVKKCEERVSKGGLGDPMFSVEFKSVDTGEHLCFDVIMMGGRGIGIGHKKLIQLGVVEDGEDNYEVDAHQLIGKRCVLTLKHETYNKKTNAKPDFEANETFGYEPESTWTSATDISNDANCPF